MFDTRDFLDAFGRFATGVAIVTTCGLDGEPVGVTGSSYNCVSLDPPLVLWSLARSSRALDAFAKSAGYTIHVLGVDHQDLASRFAASGTDKFAGVDYGEGEGRSPLLRGCAVHFECTPAYQYEGGDHIILVGKVARYEKSAAAPLVFHQGRFTRVTSSFAKAADGERHGLFTDDFLPYLLALAQSHLMRPVRRHCRELGLADSQYGMMSVLSIGGPATEAAIVAKLEEGAVLPRLRRSSMTWRPGAGSSANVRANSGRSPTPGDRGSPRCGRSREPGRRRCAAGLIRNRLRWSRRSCASSSR